MISTVELEHFKCFERLHLPLGALTLLSGTNAAGKSSVLQVLVLLHQTVAEHEWSTRLMLNGRTAKLGTVQDVVDELHGRRGFGVGLVEAGDQVRWVFHENDREALSLSVESVVVNGQEFHAPKALRHLLPMPEYENRAGFAERLRGLCYITAEREGPRDVYPLEDRQVARVVGPRGEHTVSVLYQGRDEPVREALRLPEVTPRRLLQVEARMRRFFPGCRLTVEGVKGANAVRLGLATSDAGSFRRPVHVGFGLTQVLPIVVAALSAEVDDLLLIENPEVHLHPAGQANIGGFLAEVAASGVQVVIETHSDHVLNGMRRAVKAGVIGDTEVTVHFFRPREGKSAQVVSPQIDREGNIDVWPDGFFDQFDKDMNHFAGWGD